MNYSTLSPEQTFDHLKSSVEGLSQPEAASRLQTYGPNAIQAPPLHTFWQKLLGPFSSLFVIVLIFAFVISLVSGHGLDAAVIGVVILVNAVIEWVQQWSASNVLKTLQRYDVKVCAVKRAGKIFEVPVAAIVPGDIVMLAEGDTVPADGRLVQTNGLAINESVLTGEAYAVEKTVSALRDQLELGDQKNMVFRGTSVTAGQGLACITATGQGTEFARIAHLSLDLGGKAPIQTKIDDLVRKILAAVAVIAALTFILGLLRGYDVAALLRLCLALTVSSIPEGLPVALTIILLVCIQRLAKSKALVRKLPTVETLGMVTLIATDKTGTLTRNQLELSGVWPAAEQGGLDRAMATSFDPRGQLSDPVYLAITEQKIPLPAGYQPVQAIPFAQQHRYSGMVWQKDGQYLLVLASAPEFALQHGQLTAARRKEAHNQIANFSSAGSKVIAFSTRTLHGWHGKIKPADLRGLEFAGLAAFSDALRETATPAIAAAQKAGIKVLMMTGDHLLTATQVATSVGIAQSAGQVLSGEQLEEIPDDHLPDWLDRVKALGRVLPEHKYKILKALKGREITAMTGDGVNDAPALVAADVGVALGSGTEVAKEAADMVLLDDDFATITEAVKIGRGAYDNIRKMVFYLISSNLGEVLTIIGALLAGLPLPVTAAQILWINLVTDGAVVIPLGLEKAEPGIMRRPPRRPGESLLGRTMVARTIMVAGGMAVTTLAVFAFYLAHATAKAQTMAFAALVVMQWANAFNARSESGSVFKRRPPNGKLWFGLSVAVALQALVLFGPGSRYFGLAAISLGDILALVIPFAAVIALAEAHKASAR